MSAAAGKLIGVGVGPGDPELLTLKAVRALGEADVIAFFAKAGNASHARTIAARHLRAGIIELPLLYPLTTELPKCSADYRNALADFYDGAAAKIAAHLEAGCRVVVLCEGDPLFYGSYMHLHARLASRFATEIVAGVTGMSGCWSAAGLPIAQGDDVFTVLPATLPESELARRLADADAAVVMKVGRHLPKLRRALQRSGRLDRAIYVERGTMADAKMIPLASQVRRRGAVFRGGSGSGLGGSAMTGHLAVVGIGPGDARYLTPEADAALAGAQALYGYGPYLDRVPLRAGQSRQAFDNREERARAAAALRHAAQGARVALVSGGDPGVFAMAAAVCEEIEYGAQSWRALDIAFVPGITAMLAVAARIGAPLGHDFCALSLSDNLKPWELIERRLDAAASAGFVIALYNPVSRARPWQFGAALERLRRHLPASTPVVFGRAVGRPDEARERHHARSRGGHARRHGDARHRRLARHPRHRASRAFSARLHAARRRRGERMIEPGDGIVHCLDRGRIGGARPAQHDDFDDRARARRRSCRKLQLPPLFFDMTISISCACISARSLGFAERAARGDVGDMRQRQRRIDGIDAADQDSDAAARRRTARVRCGRGRRRRCGVPAPMASTAARVSSTSIQRSPSAAFHGGRRSATNGTAALRAAASGVFRNDIRVGMRCVDQRVDALRGKMIGQAVARRRSRRREPAPHGEPAKPCGRRATGSRRDRRVERAAPPIAALPSCRRE